MISNHTILLIMQTKMEVSISDSMIFEPQNCSKIFYFQLILFILIIDIFKKIVYYKSQKIKKIQLFWKILCKI